MQEIPQFLQDHFEDPYHFGQCEGCTHEAELKIENGNCQLRVELMIGDDGAIQEAWFEAEGCSLCEGVASWACESLEGLPGRLELVESTFAGLKSKLGGEQVTATCMDLPRLVFLKALASHVAELDDDLADGTQFGGPSLREEC